MSKLIIPEISDSETTFSTGDKTPAWNTIPNEFNDWTRNPWCDMASNIFFSGLSSEDHERLKPKAGVDLQKNMKFLKHCLSTWGTKHEHKIAACGWILSETFEEPLTKGVRA